ncbi:MAG: DedA family protein [bacterium]|nr:DedA family protein [bacterium]
MILKFIEIILHLDKYLIVIVNDYSTLTYIFLFLIIFCETGLVIMPFLPGDSLLFAAGALAATGSFQIHLLFLILFIAAVLGDALNYHLGKTIGPKIFTRESSIFFHKEHLVKAQLFYEKHGKKTIILARFIPIVRTFAPFVAGIGAMSYKTFLTYNIIGAGLWCGLFTYGGFLFGNIQWVKDNFGIMIIVIILVSLAPIIKEAFTHFIKKKNSNV